MPEAQSKPVFGELLILAESTYAAQSCESLTDR